ncbi:TPA: hypothetical protein RUZ08_003489 [Vibrio cholerae]|nr:hypothetical protein [Vibrio parahaemolyticus]HDZ9198717.1 hypothetical protein [Vibrio cholerae]
MHSIIVFGFPMILVTFEWLLRSIASVDTFGFVGPTLAAAAISFVVPLTKLKEEVLEADGKEWIKVSKNDSRFVYFVWLVLLIGLLSWFWVCTLSINASGQSIADFPTHVVVGATMYVVSIGLCAIKEVV